MPWSIRENFGGCAGVKPFAVVKDGTDEVEGCHETREDAQAQIAALNAAESDNGDEQAMDPTKRKRRKVPAGSYSEPVFVPADEVKFVPDPVFMAMDPGQALGIAFFRPSD